MHTAWKPSFGIKASAVVHVGAVAALGAGLAWPWAVGGVVANHAVLTLAGLWPRSTLLGHNMLRLSPAACSAGQVAITIDDGPDPYVTPAVLDILDAAHARATFFCIGKAVEAQPRLARDIVRRGHSIENHSHGHRHHFSLMGMKRLSEEISRAQQAISDVTGQSPLFFRAPAGLRSPLLDPVLQRLNLRLVSWTRRGFDTVNHDADKIFRRLEHNLHAGDILLLHDGHSATSPQGHPVVLEVLPRIIQTLQRHDLSMVSLRGAA